MPTKKGRVMPSDQIDEPQEPVTEPAPDAAAPAEEPASEPREELAESQIDAEEEPVDHGEPVQSEEFVNFADVNGAHVHIPHGSITVVTYADGYQRIL